MLQRATAPLSLSVAHGSVISLLIWAAGCAAPAATAPATATPVTESARARLLSVDLVHRSLDAVPHHELHRVARGAERRIELLLGSLRQRLQQEIRYAGCRSADTDAQPQIVPGAHFRRHGLEPMVPRFAAAPLELQRAQRQIQLVVYDERALDRNLKEGHRFTHTLAGGVHERERLEQDQLSRVDAGDEQLAVEALAP